MVATIFVRRGTSPRYWPAGGGISAARGCSDGAARRPPRPPRSASRGRGSRRPAALRPRMPPGRGVGRVARSRRGCAGCPRRRAATDHRRRHQPAASRVRDCGNRSPRLGTEPTIEDGVVEWTAMPRPTSRWRRCRPRTTPSGGPWSRATGASWGSTCSGSVRPFGAAFERIIVKHPGERVVVVRHGGVINAPRQPRHRVGRFRSSSSPPTPTLTRVLAPGATPTACSPPPPPPPPPSPASTRPATSAASGSTSRRRVTRRAVPQPSGPREPRSYPRGAPTAPGCLTSLAQRVRQLADVEAGQARQRLEQPARFGAVEGTTHPRCATREDDHATGGPVGAGAGVYERHLPHLDPVDGLPRGRRRGTGAPRARRPRAPRWPSGPLQQAA